jgi:putative hemolysin
MQEAGHTGEASRAGEAPARAGPPAGSGQPRDQDEAVPGPIRRALTRLLVRALNISLTDPGERINEAELRQLIAANTGTRHVREVMVPRTEVTFLDATLLVTDAIRAVRVTRHSRFPVIDGSQDDVIGFVHLRDLTVRDDDRGDDTIRALTREVKRLPGSKRVLAALSEMRREGHHLAVVEDEYGGTDGIVTLEDLIEELVGEIHDEYDLAPEQLAVGARPSEVDGLLNLADFAERAGLALPPGPYETVGGFLMARLGKVPQVGEAVALDGWRLVVSEVDGRRVARVTLQPPSLPRQTTGEEC